MQRDSEGRTLTVRSDVAEVQHRGVLHHQACLRCCNTGRVVAYLGPVYPNKDEAHIESARQWTTLTNPFRRATDDADTEALFSPSRKAAA